MNDEEQYYAVEIRCENCGVQWSAEVLVGWVVKYYHYLNCLVAQDENNEENIQAFICINCGTSSMLKKINNPLTHNDDDNVQYTQKGRRKKTGGGAQGVYE